MYTIKCLFLFFFFTFSGVAEGVLRPYHHLRAIPQGSIVQIKLVDLK